MNPSHNTMCCLPDGSVHELNNRQANPRGTPVTVDSVAKAHACPNLRSSAGFNSSVAQLLKTGAE